MYQRGSYTIWEVDGANATVSWVTTLQTDKQLYCQNLSLFGKLFIDHKVSGRPGFLQLTTSPSSSTSRTSCSTCCATPRRRCEIR